MFIVIEGLDGSGKTTASKGLMNALEDAGFKVKRTYEPNNESCGGAYIRAVLTKQIKDFHPATLPHIFTANRLDHCTRVISPWIKQAKHIMLCDRYYLSSLVYQSNYDFPFKTLMEMNKYVLRPDVIFFLNVSDEVCYERISKRNEPKELFEEKLAVFRKKYEKAIEYLKTENNDTIIEIDATQSEKAVVKSMMEHLKTKN